jgi:hypothetical protein
MWEDGKHTRQILKWKETGISANGKESVERDE